LSKHFLFGKITILFIFWGLSGRSWWLGLLTCSPFAKLKVMEFANVHGTGMYPLYRVNRDQSNIHSLQKIKNGQNAVWHWSDSITGLGGGKMKVDFGLTAGDYRKYRAGYPDELYDRLKRYGVGIKGQSVLDLGTGTGYLARKFAKQGAWVTGVDISKELIKEARELDEQEGVHSRYVIARAEALPFSDSEFDVVTAGQCWHWFQADQVLKEVRRVLRPHGKLAIIHLDWLPLKGNIVEKTEKLILSYNPDWQGAGGTGVYPAWFTQVAIGGFSGIESFTFDLMIPYSQEAWRGRIRASAGVGASLPPDAIARFDHEFKEFLEKNYEETLKIPHRVFCLVCTPKEEP
jgi:SAM-dependent methyltransferase